MFFRSLKASLYVIFFAILIQFAMMAVDLYFNQRYRQLEDHHLEFARNEYNFINTLVLEKDSEHRKSSQVQLLKRYEEMILLNDSKQLKLDNSILRYRIRIASGLFGLWEQRQKLYTSLNETLPELAQSVSYIHGHHIAYLKNLIRRGVLEQDYDVGGTFKRNASQPGSELDIVSVAIDIQNSMLEIMEIFSRVQRGFSPKNIKDDFSRSISEFYRATNLFEDYSLDAQDGLLVEELLLNGATFESSFKELIDLEMAVQRENANLEWNRRELMDNIAAVRKENDEYFSEFRRRLEINKIVSTAINLVLLVVLLYVSRKIIRELALVVRETSRIEKNHSYRIAPSKTYFSEFRYIFNALNLMGQAVSKKFEELADSQSRLEEQVQARTEELTLANIKLKAEIEERVKNESQRRALEERLGRAEKMEAIGTLAGGVAHDLNNILSGIVSYPELILMDLPDDHKHRPPLEAIMTSGEQAAVIVEDLLTMARRGVARQEPLHLNELVAGFIESPECKNIQKHNPGVKIECHLDAELDTIRGSRVHLLKTLMNLVNNSAESIALIGQVTISTSTTYIDTGFKSYDNVQEGEYVQLSVRDNGSGISAENQERIFEPFFTTKTMGRSGSGLGMAVVWGTVKDHNGYIDLHSEINEGTVFDLYFPLARDVVRKSGLEDDLDCLRGKGELVLVVDDVKEQREIASQILRQLGYGVVAVESGEKAIEYIQQQHADIILLDMIMMPGLDGLETYRAILSFKSEQKALIVSGYSESEKVLEAQKLGAGSYVKKPYTIVKIAKALRTELDRDVKRQE